MDFFEFKRSKGEMKLKFGVDFIVADGVEGSKVGATGGVGAAGAVEEGELDEVGIGLKPFKIDNKD